VRSVIFSSKRFKQYTKKLEAGGVTLFKLLSSLRGTGMAFGVDFRMDFGGTVTTLGVSGFLYKRSLMQYDRQRESLD